MVTSEQQVSAELEVGTSPRLLDRRGFWLVSARTICWTRCRCTRPQNP